MSLVIEEKEIDSLPITIDPEVVSGAPVFRGTRVPLNIVIPVASNRFNQRLQKNKASECVARGLK